MICFELRPFRRVQQELNKCRIIVNYVISLQLSINIRDFFCERKKELELIFKGLNKNEKRKKYKLHFIDLAPLVF